MVVVEGIVDQVVSFVKLFEANRQLINILFINHKKKLFFLLFFTA